MSKTERVIGREAVIDDTTDPHHHVVYTAGARESELPEEFAKTLGDHVWATLDADGNPDFTPIGGLDQLKSTGVRVRVHGNASNGLLGTETVEQPADASETVPAKTVKETAASLSEHTLDELRDICDDRGLHRSGTKDEVIARLIDG